MKRLLFTLTGFLLAIPASHANDTPDLSDAELRKDLYLKLLPEVKAIHDKGPYIYSAKGLKKLKYDWKGLSPTLIAVRHNNVDIIVLNKESKIVRHNFNRFVGAWTPKKAVWNVNYYFDTAEREQVYLGGYMLSDTSYKKDRLYEEYLQSKP